MGVVDKRPKIMVMLGVISMIASAVLFATSAGAHNVTVIGSVGVICDQETPLVSWQARTWNDVDPGGRHPNIIVETRTDVSDWVVVAMAPLNDANGRRIGGVSPIAPGATSVSVRVTPDPTQFWEGTNVVGSGDTETVAIPPEIRDCGAPPATPSPTAEPTPPEPTATVPPEPTAEPTTPPEPSPSPEPTPAESPTTEATSEPAPTPTERPAETPTPATPASPTPAPEVTPSPEPTSPPTPQPTAEAPEPTVVEARIDAAIRCTDAGVEVELDAVPGTLIDIVVDGALHRTVDIGATGTELVQLDQEPGETNDIQARVGDEILAQGRFSCVEGVTSPGNPDQADDGNPDDEPEVRGRQQLADTGAESAVLTLLAFFLLVAGAVLTAGGVTLGRRQV